MAARNPQTHAKRARELAVKEKRELKRAKKAERAAAAQEAPPDAPEEGGTPEQDEIGGEE
jgi:hypothetical protein